jgi:hypothetical protein
MTKSAFPRVSRNNADGGATFSSTLPVDDTES